MVGSRDVTRAAALVVARMGSSRLPGKHLAVVQGRPVIEHLIERVRQARRVTSIVLCTTTRPADAALAQVADRAGIQHFRGSELNVLARMLGAARQCGAEFLVVVEADEVFCDWELMDALIERYERAPLDYVELQGVPLGSFLHGVRTDVLERVCGLLEDETKTDDGWNRYFLPEGGLQPPCVTDTLVVEDPAYHCPEARLTLDWPEDLALIRAIFARIDAPGREPSLREVIALLRREPQLLELNRHLIRAYAERVAAFAPPRALGSTGA